MPPDVPGDPVGGARRTCDDRLVAQVAADVRRQLRRGRVAAPPVLLQRLEGDGVEVPPQLASEGPSFGGGARPPEAADPGTRLRRIHLADLPAELVHATVSQLLGGERERPGQEFVEDDPQRIDVGPGVDVLRPEVRLLRAHVLRSSDECPGLGEQRALGEPLSDGLRHSEVDDLRLRPVVHLGHQDVRRFEVTVNDRLLVGVLNSVADLAEQLEALNGREPLFLAVAIHRNAGHVLHDEVRPTLGRRASVEDLGDPRVVHQSEGLPLGLEARHDLPAVHARLDDLQGHPSPDRGHLLREPHLSHPPFGDELQETVRTDLFALADARRAVGE
jgi:hypothetical protein